MPVPSNPNAMLGDVVRRILVINGIIKQRTQDAKAKALTDATSSKDILDFADQLRRCKAELAVLAAVPGIAAEATSQLGNSNLVDGYAAMVTALNGVVSWIATTHPKDGNGFALAFTLSADASIVWRTWAAATLNLANGYVSKLDALSATIA